MSHVTQGLLDIKFPSFPLFEALSAPLFPPSFSTPVSDADETMRQAIERFRTRMEAANRKFLQDRVNEIEAKGLTTEEEKLFEMRSYRGLWDLGVGGVAVFGSPDVPPELVREAHELRQVTRLAEVPAVTTI